VGLVVGDKIKIQDDTLSEEINYVATIVDPTHITILNGASKTYYKDSNPQIKVLRDAFSNTHMHQIRNNEVELLRISAYLDRGYPSAHAHRVLPIIQDVSSLILDTENIIAAGSGSSIYKSPDNGVTWDEMVDLNNFIESSAEVDGVSTMSLRDDKVIAGATNGSLFVEIEDNSATVVPLNKP